MIYNETSRLAFLLNDIQDTGLKKRPESHRFIDNLTVADFLLLNGIRQPPVKIGTIVTNTAGANYVVVSYNAKHTAKGIQEEVELMREEYLGEVCYRTRKITPAEFYKEFKNCLEEKI